MYDWMESKDATAYTECAKKSWLYDSSQHQWTLTPFSDSSYLAFYVTRTGYVIDYHVGNNFAGRPGLYIKSDTKIVGGLGTYDQPFDLGA